MMRIVLGDTFVFDIIFIACAGCMEALFREQSIESGVQVFRLP
jgi:hypothetical protein